MQSRTERAAAFALRLRSFEVVDLRQAAVYLRQQIELRERAVTMVGISSVTTVLGLIEENERISLGVITEALWEAADYVPLYHAWPHNQTTKPILQMVIEEAHLRQGLATSPALTSLTCSSTAPPQKEPCATPKVPQHSLTNWLRSLRQAG